MLEYVLHAFEKEKEQAAWELWQQMYPWMAAGLLNFVSFGDFTRELLKPQVRYTDKNREEIENEMMAVVAAYEHK